MKSKSIETYLLFLHVLKPDHSYNFEFLIIAWLFGPLRSATGGCRKMFGPDIRFVDVRPIGPQPLRGEIDSCRYGSMGRLIQKKSSLRCRRFFLKHQVLEHLTRHGPPLAIQDRG